MKREKNGITVFLVILIVAVIFISYFWGWDIGAKLHPDQTAYSLIELTQLVNEQINSGKEQGDFYIQGITKEEIDNINEYLCCLYGSVYKYSILEKTRTGMKIRLIYNISDNYYVYRRYKYNEPIPASAPTAQKLYEEVVKVIETIIKPGMTDYEKELAIHDYLVVNCEYGYTEASQEYAYRAYGALIQNKAVCNGYAEAMALLLECVDVQNDIMTGTALGELHAWNRVCLDGKWYQVDATWDDPVPDRGSFAGHMYFNVTDDVMDDTHIWINENYEACDSWDYNYFQKNNLICNRSGFESNITGLAYRDLNGMMEIVVTDYSDNYDMNFLSNINGVENVAYSQDAYGDYEIITVHLNTKE